MLFLDDCSSRCREAEVAFVSRFTSLPRVESFLIEFLNVFASTGALERGKEQPSSNESRYRHARQFYNKYRMRCRALRYVNGTGAAYVYFSQV